MPRPRGHGPAFRARCEEVIDNAAKLIARRGYGAMGIAELAEVLGMGKGALYRYIGSKEKLLVEIQDRVVVPLIEASRPIAQLDAAPLPRLRLLSEMLLTIIVSNLDHVRVYENDHHNLSGENRKAFVSRRDEYQGLIRGIIEEAIADGAFRDIDARPATLQFLNLHNRTYEWYDPAGPWDVAFLSRECCTTLFYGLCPDRRTRQWVEAEVERLGSKIGVPALSAKMRVRRSPGPAFS
jgi:AcrR family transcriptional regulator